MAATRGKVRSVSPKLRISLRAIVYSEDAWWLAHCLEMDLVAEGDSPQDAMRTLANLIDIQIQTALDEGDLDGVFRPAPAETWRLFFMGQEATAPRKPARPVDALEVRELRI
jgi:hypothetical protein